MPMARDDLFWDAFTLSNSTIRADPLPDGPLEAMLSRRNPRAVCFLSYTAIDANLQWPSIVPDGLLVRKG
jgi:hypothetical protein